MGLDSEVLRLTGLAISWQEDLDAQRHTRALSLCDLRNGSTTCRDCLALNISSSRPSDVTLNAVVFPPKGMKADLGLSLAFYAEDNHMFSVSSSELEALQSSKLQIDAVVLSIIQLL